MPPQSEMTSVYTPTSITNQQFLDRYWFNSLQMVTVINPAWYRGENGNDEPVSADYPFMVELRHFIIRAKQQERLPGVIANVYLDQMSKILAQNDGKLSFMTDPTLMKIYYDKLIVDVEDLAPKYDPTPAYLRDIDPRLRAQAPDDTPPWEQPNMENARTVAPSAPVADPPPGTGASYEKKKEPPETVTEPQDKQFDYEGSTYKMSVAENGHKTFYKNGIAITNAEYNRVASLL